MPAITFPKASITGPLGKSLAGVAWLVASSATFQGLVGAASAQAALDSYVHAEADDSDDTVAARPRAVVMHASAYAEEKAALAAFRWQGGLLLSFEFRPSDKYRDNLWDERLEFVSRCDSIRKEVLDLQGQGAGYFSAEAHWPVSAIELVDGPTAITEIKQIGGTEQADYFWGATFLVSWKS